LDEAETVFSDLSQELNQVSMPFEWARATLNLGHIRRDKGVETNDVSKIQQSIATLQDCLSVKPFTENRAFSAALNFSLAKSYLAEAQVEIDQSRALRDQLNPCRRHCHAVLKVLLNEPGNQLVADVGAILQRVEELETIREDTAVLGR